MLHFQPKIIIGSVCGIVASIVGFIAVFFPSFFNLETKKIDEFVCEIKNDKDAYKLFTFLKDHQGRIIKINIKYGDGVIFYDRKSGVSLGNCEEWGGDIKECFFEGRVNVGLAGWNDINDKIVIDTIGKKIDFDYVEKLANSNRINQDKGKFGFTPFGDNKLFSVVSDYNTEYHGDYAYRENGGFGFWAKSVKLEKQDLKYSNTIYLKDLCFQIEIMHGTNGNKIFKWGKEMCHGEIEDEDCHKEVLSGIFFVNQANLSPTNTYMSPKFEWDSAVNGAYGERLPAPVTFSLDPLTQKELDLKNY